MEDYFAHTLSKLKSRDYSRVTVVMGNESCDLDSAISSLVYAMFLHWQYRKIQSSVCSLDPDKVKHELFVSVLDVPREDFELKTEVAYMLNECGVKKENLIFSDDIDLQDMIKQDTIKIVLVDHHVLSKKFEYLAPYVSEVLDHRPMEKCDYAYMEKAKTNIKVVGSCCTLVCQCIKDSTAGLSALGTASFFTELPVYARMLYGTIVLDTVNFSKQINKATPDDEEMVQYLETVIKPDNCEQERRAALARLREARAAVRGLSAAQLLRKDAKVVADVLVPSLPVLVEEFLSKPDAEAALNEALTKRQCSIALLLGMRLEPQLERDVAIYSPGDRAAAEALASSLQEWSSPALQLAAQPAGAALRFQQHNLSASRKQYMPALAHFLGQR